MNRMIFLAAAIMFLNTIPVLAADGWQQSNSGQWSYVQNDKKVTNQWALWPDGTKRFVEGNGEIAVCKWVNYEEKRYYVKEDGSPYINRWFSFDSVPKNPLAQVTTTWYYADADGAILKDGWYSIGGKNYYFNADGNSLRKVFFNLGDKRFYVDENGARQENGWFSITTTNATNGITSTNWHYANADGTLLKNGWHNLGGSYYYFDVNGYSPRKNWVNVGQSRFYVDENGARQQNGWFSIKGTNANGQEYENWHYALPDGVILRECWADIDGGRYFFDQTGISYRKRWFIDGEKNRYYLDDTGVLQKNGWFRITNKNANTGAVSETWYNAGADGSVLKDGYQTIDGKMYYFDQNGISYRKRWLNTEKGGRQYFGVDGVLYQNAWFGIEGTRADGSTYTNWYHADEKGNMQKKGWYTIDGKEYYLNTSGNMATEWFDDKQYYLGEDGAKRYGWQWLEIPDSWYGDDDDDDDRIADYVGEYGKYAYFYFSGSTGRKRYCTSGTYMDIRIDGVTYGFDNYGILQRGWVKIKGMSPALKGYRYYFQDEGSDIFKQGQLVKGSWLKLALPDGLDGPGGEEWHYFGPNGEPVCASEGKYVIEEIDGKRYAFDMYGNARYGLLEINSEVYYFGAKDGNRAGAEGRCTFTETDTGEKEEYCFNGKGRGITGIENGYFYYKGKLQKADRNTKYEVFNVPGKGKRLIHSSGKVVKGKTVQDGDGGKWVISPSGKIREYGSDYVAEIEEPETEEYD